jgi:hypothetical protein
MVPVRKDLDHNAAMTGDDLVAFVNGRLFPYLHGFKAKATGPNQNPAAHPSPESQRRGREIFVASRTTRNSSSVRSDIFWRCRPVGGMALK